MPKVKYPGPHAGVEVELSRFRGEVVRDGDPIDVTAAERDQLVAQGWVAVASDTDAAAKKKADAEKRQKAAKKKADAEKAAADKAAAEQTQSAAGAK